MSEAICIDQLSKNYGEVQALNKVSFKVPTGSLFGLIGPNGAGKTTLFSLLSNFIQPCSGQIKILGQSTQHYHQLYTRISVLPQDALLYKNRSILSQLIFIAKLIGLSNKEAKEESLNALKMVHLEDKKHANARELSHGMTKRLGIAQALIGSPEIILLDEPLAGLDPTLAKNIKELIVSLKSDKTVIISSHNLLELQEICDHAAILSKGHLKTSGPLSEIMGHHNQVYFTLDRPPVLDTLRNHPAVHECNFYQDTMRLHISYHHEQINLSEINAFVFSFLLKQNIGIQSISPGSSLEDSYLKMIRS